MASIVAGVDTRRFHVGHHLAGGGLHLPAGAAVAQDGLAAVLDHRDGERDRDEVGRQGGLHHRGLDVHDRKLMAEGKVTDLRPPLQGSERDAGVR